LPNPNRGPRERGGEVVFALAHVSIQPDAGWIIFRPDLQQKETDVQILGPNLWASNGQVAGVLFPNDGLTPAQQADRFAGKSPGPPVERKEITTPSGISLVRLTLKQKLKGRDVEALSISHFFTNEEGRVVMIYFVGEPSAASQANEMMVRTLKYNGSGI
jgi:hypothetical protein